MDKLLVLILSFNLILNQNETEKQSTTWILISKVTVKVGFRSSGKVYPLKHWNCIFEASPSNFWLQHREDRRVYQTVWRLSNRAAIQYSDPNDCLLVRRLQKQHYRPTHSYCLEGNLHEYMYCSWEYHLGYSTDEHWRCALCREECWLTLEPCQDDWQCDQVIFGIRHSSRLKLRVSFRWACSTKKKDMTLNISPRLLMFGKGSHLNYSGLVECWPSFEANVLTVHCRIKPTSAAN